MHRTLTVVLPASETDAFTTGLLALDEVIGLSVSRGASLKPPGDVVTVHVLNRGADAVLRRAAAIEGPVSVVTAEAASFIDPAHAAKVETDVDEAVWEEMETGLRHQGRVTPNYLALMGLGGAMAAVGLVSEPVPQAIAFVASAIIAPGFEPVAKVPLGLVLRRWAVAGRGLYSAALGYAVLVLAAALTFWAMKAGGAVTDHDLLANPEVARIGHPDAAALLVSACGAVAGIVMLAAYRRSVIAGPLIALTIIPAAALIGMAPVAGRWPVAGGGGGGGAARRRPGADRPRRAARLRPQAGGRPPPPADGVTAETDSASPARPVAPSGAEVGTRPGRHLRRPGRRNGFRIRHPVLALVVHCR